MSWFNWSNPFYSALWGHFGSCKKTNVFVFVDAWEHGVPPKANQSGGQWRRQCRAGWSRLCNVVWGDGQGTVSGGGSRNDALGVCVSVCAWCPFCYIWLVVYPLITLSPTPSHSVAVSQICREAEGAIFHQQLFEDLRRLTPLSSDPTEVTAIGAVESSFKCCAGAIIVLTTSGRCVFKTPKNYLHGDYWIVALDTKLRGLSQPIRILENLATAKIHIPSAPKHAYLAKPE